jgi:hypothetical protein
VHAIPAPAPPSALALHVRRTLQERPETSIADLVAELSAIADRQEAPPRRHLVLVPAG